MAEKLTKTYAFDEMTLYKKAKAELEKKLNEKLSQFNPTFKWDEEDKSGTFDIKGVKGNVLISGSTLTVEMDIPFMLKPFKGKIMEHLESSMENIAKS